MKLDDYSSTTDQQSSIETAAWDAMTSAVFAVTAPRLSKEVASWKIYVEPNYAEHQQRILGSFSIQPYLTPSKVGRLICILCLLDNLRRAQDFKTKSIFDIIVNCRDSKSLCESNKNDKAVGGYAWTLNGWFGYYHYIVLCPFLLLWTLWKGRFQELRKRLNWRF